MSRAARRWWTGLSFAVALAGSGRATAEEPGAEPGDPAAEIRAQAEKVLGLMRENEAALLEASRAGGAPPKPVEVEKPAAPPATPPRAETAEGGATPPDRAAEIRRRWDELVRASVERSRAIPKEIEELLRMIPP